MSFNRPGWYPRPAISYGADQPPAGGGDMSGASSLIMAFVAVAQTIGMLIELGFDTEYRPKRRANLLASSLPMLTVGLRKQYEAYAKAIEKGQTAKANRIMNERKTFAPSAFLLGVPVAVSAESDDSLVIESYAKAVKSNGRNTGNIVETQDLARKFVAELVYFAATPEMIVRGSDPKNGWAIAKNAAKAEIQRLLSRPEELALIWPASPEVEKGRMPFAVRDDILAFYMEALGSGLLPANTPLPWWVMGYSNDDVKPLVPITLEVYTALMQAVQTNQITNATLTALGA